MISYITMAWIVGILIIVLAIKNIYFKRKDALCVLDAEVKE